MIDVNTIGGPTKLVRQDAISGRAVDRPITPSSFLLHHGLALNYRSIDIHIDTPYLHRSQSGPP